VIDPLNPLETELQAIRLPFALQLLQLTSSTETPTITATNPFNPFSRDQAFKEFLCPFYLT